MKNSHRLAGFTTIGMRKSTERVFMAGLFVVIILFLLGMLMMGTMVYRALNNASSIANDSRLGLSLISNSIRMTDATDAVGVGNAPEGKSLVLTDRLDNGTFETRIYHYQGNIVQEYASAASPYTPEKARVLVASEIFDFEYTNGLLTVYTDRGSTAVALHSVRGGA